ncbi:hypothetical protein ACFVZW_00010 [Streptomyces sp. NPDC059567]|uniref:hypothetical protein n=1 Tax=Streptomyces sp. NPDC059567 TaxID=3346867 RepID=UPI00367F9CB4
MSIAIPSSTTSNSSTPSTPSTASTSEPEHRAGTTRPCGEAPQAEAPAPEAVAPAPSAPSGEAASLPIAAPALDAIAVAEIRRKVILDALDPGPRPGTAAKPSRRRFLSRVKAFYAQEVIHDAPKPENNG